MSERQAKRLRRAMRAYVAEKQPGLEKGPRAKEAAEQLAKVLRAVWPRIISHRARGRIAVDLRGPYNLQRAVMRCVS